MNRATITHAHVGVQTAQNEVLPSPKAHLYRWIYLGAGWTSFAAGVVGIVLPVMPTTVFMLMALWCFSRGSPRIANWLFSHSWFGKSLRAWHLDRVIPLRAKIISAIMMLSSLGYLCFFAKVSNFLLIGLGVLFAALLTYIFSRPHRRLPLVSKGPLSWR